MTATLTLDFTSLSEAPSFPMIALAHASDDGAVMSASAALADNALDGALDRALKEAEFKAKPGQTLVVRGGAGTVIVIGAWEALEAGKAAEDLGGHVFSALGKAGVKSATLCLDDDHGALVADVAHGAHLASYVFRHYFTKGDKAEVKMSSLTVASNAADAADHYAKQAELAAGVFLARDLVFEPANKLYPESYAERCQSLTEAGLKVTVLDEDAMRKEGMDLLLSVGQGSRRASRMVVMEWNGGAKGDAPVALVGKGVTFDTGGISIKPAGGMEDMKWDMGGSAAVVGAMRSLAGR
ncbi:MAG: hypothetical protein J4F41_09135 [Alphaproteobacteria bacterium]|nr:hypothetical protein [Alphaproteobacteria bacterium]